MEPARTVEQPIRAAEVIGALSLATDLGTGQPLEHAMRSAVLAVRLGELAGASQQELVETYYVALLHASGCTSNGHEAAQLFGDDIEHREAFFLVDTTNPAEVLAFYKAYVGAGRSPEVRAAMLEDAIANAAPRGRGVVLDDVRGGAAIRRLARPRSERPGGTRIRLRPLGRAGSPTSRVMRSRCRCGCCTSVGTSRCFSPPGGLTKPGPLSSDAQARPTTPGWPRLPFGASRR